LLSGVARQAGADVQGLVATGNWRDPRSAARYAHANARRMGTGGTAAQRPQSGRIKFILTTPSSELLTSKRRDCTLKRNKIRVTSTDVGMTIIRNAKFRILPPQPRSWSRTPGSGGWASNKATSRPANLVFARPCRANSRTEKRANARRFPRPALSPCLQFENKNADSAQSRFPPSQAAAFEARVAFDPSWCPRTPGGRRAARA
jgi:hypothetical protein